MVSVKVRYEVVETNDPFPRYLGRAFDTALPNTFWQDPDYVIDTVWEVGQATQETISMLEGYHYIIVGTSAEPTSDLYHKIKVQFKDPNSGAVVAEITTDKVHRSQYYAIIFKLTTTGAGTFAITELTGQTISPGEEPEIEPSGGETGGGLSTIMEQMRTMMGSMFNMMAQMMMYMAMMQLMVGMMSGLAGAMAGAF